MIAQIAYPQQKEVIPLHAIYVPMDFISIRMILIALNVMLSVKSALLYQLTAYHATKLPIESIQVNVLPAQMDILPKLASSIANVNILLIFKRMLSLMPNLYLIRLLLFLRGKLLSLATV
jgi:hypothetical protein